VSSVRRVKRRPGLAPFVTFLIGFGLMTVAVASWGQVGSADTRHVASYQTGAIVFAVIGAAFLIAAVLYDIDRHR
jgi:hypothetical protein